MNKFIYLSLFILVLSCCSPSRQTVATADAATRQAATSDENSRQLVATAIARTRVANFTPTSSITPTFTQTETPAFTPTPVSFEDCQPITGVTYNDLSKAIARLRGYVSGMPGVASISYVVTEKVYTSANSELVQVAYTGADGKAYSRRYIIYIEELGWKAGLFSIDGQCWIDPPH